MIVVEYVLTYLLVATAFAGTLATVAFLFMFVWNVFRLRSVSLAGRAAWSTSVEAFCCAWWRV